MACGLVKIVSAIRESMRDMEDQERMKLEVRLFKYRQEVSDKKFTLACVDGRAKLWVAIRSGNASYVKKCTAWDSHLCC